MRRMGRTKLDACGEGSLAELVGEVVSETRGVRNRRYEYWSARE